MSAIGKGDWVQSLIDHEFGTCIVRRSDVFCVDFFEPATTPCNRCGDDGPGFILVGAGRPFVTRGQFCHCEFKPLGGSALTRERSAPQDLVTEWERKMQDA